MTVPQPYMEASNLLEAYRTDMATRDRCNAKGIYITYGDSSTSLTLYLTEAIEGSTQYIEFTELAVSLSSNDTIVVVIDSPGGYLSGAQMIITGLHSTEAATTAVVTDQAASAATIIALACDDLMMREHSSFMCHAAAWGQGGKYHEIASATEHNLKQVRKMLEQTYKYFMSEEEIERMLRGEDFYFDDEETMLRWSYVEEAREIEVKKHETALLEEQIAILEGQLESMRSFLPKEEKAKPKRRKVTP